MVLSSEVWLIIFSFLPYNDLIEASAICKLFYKLLRKNSGYIEKLSHSRQLFNNSRIVFTCYEDVCLSFSGQVFHYLMQYIREKDCFFDAKKIIMDRLFHSILPFRVWNHMFYCIRSEYCVDMCLLCTKIYVPVKKISDHINKHSMFLLINFILWLERTLLLQTRYFFAHKTPLLRRMIQRKMPREILGCCITDASAPLFYFLRYTWIP